MSADGWDQFAMHWLVVFGLCITALCLADALWRAWRQHRRQRDWRRVAAPQWACRRLTNGQWIVERRR